MSLLQLFQYGFIGNMFAAGFLASIACGIMGTYVVVKRLVFISGGISHTCFGGIGLAYFMGFDPMIGALLFALTTATTLGLVSLKTHIREDSTIGVFWAVGMALGLLFISKTPGYVPDPMSFLFGNILLVKSQDLLLMSLLVVVIATVVLLFYRQILALTFDEEFARISGVPTERLYILLLTLVALTIVLFIKVVGVILVIALLTIPATIAGFFTHDMRRMMVLAVLTGVIITTIGSLASLQYDIPSGATIVVVAGLALIIAAGMRKLQERATPAPVTGTPSTD